MKEIFARRIRELRGTQKQSETAIKLGISAVRLSRLESGKTEPDLQTIAAFAKKFRVTADWLLGLTDERNPPAAQVVTANANAPNATASATVDDSAAIVEAVRLLAAARAPVVDMNAADLARRMDALEAAVGKIATAVARVAK